MSENEAKAAPPDRAKTDEPKTPGVPFWLLELGNVVGSALLFLLNGVLAGVAAVPAGYLMLQVHAHFPWWAVALAVPFAYLAWGISMCTLVLMVKWGTFYRPKPGANPVFGPSGARWGLMARLVGFCHDTFVRNFVGTPFVNLWFRLLGAKVGRRVIMNTTDLSDWDLLDIGDDVILGAGAVVICHVVEMGELKLMPVKIGDGCSVGRNTVIFPGCTIGEGSVVGAMSLLTKNRTIPPGQIWGGAPATYIRERAAKK